MAYITTWSSTKPRATSVRLLMMGNILRIPRMISPQGWCWTALAPPRPVMCPVTHSSLSACSIVLIPSMLYSPSASSSCSQSLLVTCCCSDLLLQVPQLGWLNADLPISIPNLLILGCQYGRNFNLMLSLRNSHPERWMSSK